MKLTRLPNTVAALPAALKTPPKIAELFYQSPEWRSLVASIKRKRGGWCERCGSTRRVIGDHIIERKDGGAELDESNIQLLCIRCHNTKTAKAKAFRVLR